MATILIADDHPTVRAGLRRFLEEESSITEIGEAASGSETLERLSTGQWNLVILDINMPDRSGVDVLRSIRTNYPDTKVLVLSSFPERQYAVNMLKAGAGGYLPKECAPADLIKATRALLQGRRYVSAGIVQALASDVDTEINQPLHGRLSEREFQIFCKIAAGQRVSVIADELHLSIKTVSTYRTRLLEKMNMITNADLTSYALRNQLVSFD